MPLSLELNERNRKEMRDLQMVFQNPHDALNPYQTVGQAIGRTYDLLTEGSQSQEDTQARVDYLLQAVGLSADYATRYPNQLSGGEKQRVAIARAFAASPALVVADEPTSSLDVSVQAVILNLLKDLRTEEEASYLFISHDLEVIRYLADWIVVMYLGEVMDQGPSEDIASPPMHPYTEALLSAVPLPDPDTEPGHIRLEGDIPSPRNKPTGCPFHTRCHRYLGDICRDVEPPLYRTESGQTYRCHIEPEELAELQAETVNPLATEGGND
jgi:peptide/nickel transport system ATP-binding protein